MTAASLSQINGKPLVHARNLRWLLAFSILPRKWTLSIELSLPIPQLIINQSLYRNKFKQIKEASFHQLLFQQILWIRKQWQKTWDLLKHLLSGNTRQNMYHLWVHSTIAMANQWLQLKLQMRLIFTSLVLDVISLEKLLRVVDTIVNISKILFHSQCYCWMSLKVKSFRFQDL